MPLLLAAFPILTVIGILQCSSFPFANESNVAVFQNARHYLETRSEALNTTWGYSAWLLDRHENQQCLFF